MPQYISPGMLTEIRHFATAALAHTYTRVPVVASLGDPEDAWGEIVVEDGLPVTGLPCMLTFSEAATPGEAGAVTTKVPLLWIGHTDELAVGDRVEDVRDGDGLLLLDHAVVVRWEASPDRGGAVTLVVELSVAEAVTQPAGGS